jgi:hypothetical protein
MNPFLRLLAIGLTVAVLQLPTQAAPSPRTAAASQVRGEAAAALSAGNPALALATLRGAASRSPLAPTEDAQVISTLCSLARELEANAPGGGRAAAGLALNEGKRARTKMNPREAALTDLALGELNELTLGDHDKARAYYEAALGAGATSAAARRGLDRIAWREALINAKASENISLRRRTT